VKKLFFLVLLSITVLVARDNPFESSTISVLPEIGVVTEDTSDNYLAKEEIYLPSNARRLKKITIDYMSVDGVLRKKEISMDLGVDYHSPIVLTQEKHLPLAEISQSNPKNSGNLSVIEQPISNEEVHTPFDFVTFKAVDKEIHILTKDKKIRDFALPNPNKIVVDFKPRDVFSPKLVKMKYKKYFKNIALGAHRDFYRVAIELNGKYIYDISKIDDGYRIIIK
jgi:hypothetical protein